MIYFNLNESDTKELEIDFLFQNGLYFTSKFKKNLTLNEIKTKLWSILIENHLDTWLKSINLYYFQSIGADAKNIHFYDLSQKLSDLNLFENVFQVVEIEKSLEEKILDSEIEKSIGINQDELDCLKDEELIEYRLNLFELIRDELEKGKKQNDLDLIKNFYSPNLVINLEPNSKSYVNFEITIHDESENTFKNLSVLSNSTPVEILSVYFKTISNYSSNPKTHALNVCGCKDVVFGDENRIGDYKYIQKCIYLNKKPNFYIRTFEDLKRSIKTGPRRDLISLVDKSINELKFKLNSKAEQEEKKAFISLNISEEFKIFVNHFSHIPNLFDCDKVYFKTCILNGSEFLTKIIESKKYELSLLNQEKCLHMLIDELFEYNIKISNLPRCCKLCIGLFYSTRKKRTNHLVSFVSINLFDFKQILVNGKKNFFMWRLGNENESFEDLCKQHISGTNPEKDSVYIKLEFESNYLVKFPSDQEMERFYIEYPKSDNQVLINEPHWLMNVINKDSLYQLKQLEKEFLWSNRYECLNYPNSLSKLAQCVVWSEHYYVNEFYNLLSKWPCIEPSHAVLMLHSSFMDIKLRSFAVECLEKRIKDEELEFYLLQLIQGLKNEPYFINDLSKFLLKRALKSTRIGLKFFWILKTEMSDIKFRLKFGILLESYCKKHPVNFYDMLKQIDVVNNLTNLSQSIKKTPNNIQLIKSTFFQDLLSKKEYKMALSDLINPIEPSITLGEIDPSECKILASAKRPLYLSWKNDEIYSDFFEKNFEIIFKNGDDLRQDMLTIQALKLMDIIWKKENLDLKMLLYECFPTGKQVGFIEIVKNASTIFKIQTEGGTKGRYQIENDQLYKWICLHNPNEKLDIAIDNFTKSSAGFCVATFILGIGDRHPSNIMVNKEGKLFHIDFGHFLGHFKQKFGIKRERVPFVLTQDFTKVITRCSLVPFQTEEFKQFKELCEQAYLILRKHASLIIDLFVLMLSSEMPELKSTEDIKYLRNKLAVDLSEQEALDFFRDQFNEALVFSFTTKVDWVFHALNHRG